MDISMGGRNKYQRYERQGRKRHVLICIKDGARMEFWDEGPFAVGPDGKVNAKWQTQLPSPGRQKLVAALLKRDHNGLPIFVSEERGQRVWDQATMREIVIPHINDEIREAMEQYGVLREQNIVAGRLELESRRVEAKAQKATDATRAASTPMPPTVKASKPEQKGGAA